MPKFQRTEKNFKIIFWPEEIKLLCDSPERSDIKRIKLRVKEYINILKPDFNLSDKNKKQMNALIKQVDETNDPKEIRKLFDQMTIYKTMSELNADQIAEYINKIKELIGDDEQKAKAFLSYLFANGKLPDFIANDPDLAGFVHYVKNAFEKSKDDFQFWVALASSASIGSSALSISAAILGPGLSLALPAIPLTFVILSPGIIALALLGTGGCISRSRLKKNLAAIKTKEFTKQLGNLKKEIDKALEKDPKLKQQVKSITEKIEQQETKDEQKQNIKEISNVNTENSEDLASELTTEIMLDVSRRDIKSLTEQEVYNFIDENYKADAAERKKNIKEVLDNTTENREKAAANILQQLVDGKKLQEKQAEQKEENVVESQNKEKNNEEDLNHDANTEGSIFDIAGRNLFDNEEENKNTNAVISLGQNSEIDNFDTVFDIAGRNLFDVVEKQEKQAEQKEENVVKSQNKEKNKEEDLDHTTNTEESNFDFDKIPESDDTIISDYDDSKNNNEIDNNSQYKDPFGVKTIKSINEEEVSLYKSENTKIDNKENSSLKENISYEKKNLDNSFRNDDKQSKNDRKIDLNKIKGKLKEVKKEQQNKDQDINNDQKEIFAKLKEFEQKRKQKKPQNKERNK